jgi:hypothetical protein
MTRMIAKFAVSDISHGTAARKLQKAIEAGVFISERDQTDNRKQRYYLHPEMIVVCSGAFESLMRSVPYSPPYSSRAEVVSRERVRQILERISSVRLKP